MTRQQYLWLFMWIFIFFLLFCTWNKLQYYTPQVPDNSPTKQSQSKAVKEIYFKVIKKDNLVIISGIVPHKDDRNMIIDAYGKVFHTINTDALRVDTSAKSNDLLEFFTNFADNFSKFDAGYLAFSNGNLEIDGIAQHEIVNQTLKEQLSSLNNIKIDNRLFIKPKRKKTEKEVQKELDSLLIKKRVQFLYARDILTTESKLLIDKIATLLKANDTIKIAILGHTDSDGTKKRNLKLSQRRAESVKKELLKQGIKEKRMKSIGYGESRPLVPNNSLKNKEINRRVEFKVIGE